MNNQVPPDSSSSSLVGADALTEAAEEYAQSNEKQQADRVAELEAALASERAITRRLREGLAALELQWRLEADLNRGCTNAAIAAEGRMFKKCSKELRALLRDTTQEGEVNERTGLHRMGNHRSAAKLD